MEVLICVKRKYESNAIITNFRTRNGVVHANLLDSNGRLLISATLDYITEQLHETEFSPPGDPNRS